MQPYACTYIYINTCEFQERNLAIGGYRKNLWLLLQLLAQTLSCAFIKNGVSYGSKKKIICNKNQVSTKN